MRQPTTINDPMIDAQTPPRQMRRTTIDFCASRFYACFGMDGIAGKGTRPAAHAELLANCSAGRASRCPWRASIVRCIIIMLDAAKVLKMLLKYTGHIGFLDNLLFRFTPPGGLNDPAEALPKVLFEKYAPEDYEETRRSTRIFSAQPLNDRTLEILMQPWPGRRTDEKSFPGLWPATEPRLRPEPFDTLEEMDRCTADKAVALCWRYANEHLGVFCLAKQPSEPMWAYYADSHAGLVVRFDEHHPFFKGRVSPMVYSDRPFHVSIKMGLIRIAGQQIRYEAVLNEAIDALPVDLLLRKAEGWKHEQELRMILPLLDADQRLPGCDANGYPICLFRIPGAAISSVVLGYRAPDAVLKDAMARIAANPELDHIEVWRRRFAHGISEERLR